VTSRTLTQWLTASHGTSFSDMLRGVAARHGSRASWLVPAIYAGCLAAFITDLRSDNTLAFGVFYAPLIVTGVFYRDKRAVWYLTAIACVMDIVGSVLPVIAVDVEELVENRSLSILALLATAAFTWHARNVQDRLAEQTSRAAAAERIKTEVLTNLSQEIRAPLYSMIGVLELVAVDSRPDQKAALGMVRTAGRRLVTTVDNLVDLTQFEERAMPAEPVDLGQLLRQTADARRQDAAARQIALTISIPAGHDAIADANPWAVRRILENKIADAITYTPPGGRIEVSTITEKNHVNAVIAATGSWPAGAMYAENDPDAALLTPSVMGLALSQRLARSMGGRLVFSNGPDEGTTVRLRLPAATREEPDDA
jgi:two-component system, NarL family, sensor kinase